MLYNIKSQVANAYLLSSTWLLADVNHCIQALEVLLSFNISVEGKDLVANTKSKLHELQRIVAKDVNQGIHIIRKRSIYYALC